MSDATPNTPPAPPGATDRLLYRADVARTLGRSTVWLAQQVRAGTFPPPSGTLGRREFWLSSVVDAFIRAHLHVPEGRSRA